MSHPVYIHVIEHSGAPMKLYRRINPRPGETGFEVWSRAIEYCKSEALPPQLTFLDFETTETEAINGGPWFDSAADRWVSPKPNPVPAEVDFSSEAAVQRLKTDMQELRTEVRTLAELVRRAFTEAKDGSQNEERGHDDHA